MTHRPLAFRHAVLAALVLLVAGCGRMSPTSPDRGIESAAKVVAPAPDAIGTPNVVPVEPPPPGASPAVVVEVVRHPFIVSNARRGLLAHLLDFVLAAVVHVLPGTESLVQGGPWSLLFHPASLATPKDITVSTAGNGQMIVEFGPDGTVFGTPVDVAVDYSGTELDPNSSRYVPGMTPQFLWYDPALGAWVVVPSTVDAAHHAVHAQLRHFSRYALGGRAGW